jgi:glycosyltransferase involved in cell wall biosynthesis
VTSAAAPLKVLHLTSVETSNYYLNNLVRFTPPEKVEFRAVTLGRASTFVSDLEALGVPAWALEATTRRSYPRALARLIALVREEGIDLLHLHLFEPTLLGLVAAARTGRPALVTRHHSDAIHRLPEGLKRRAYAAAEGWISRRAAHIVAPSRRVKAILEAEGVAASKVSLIPYGQTTERFDAVRREDPRVLRDRLRFGTPALVCVSRLHPEKGHRVLFEAFARLRWDHPGATLSLVGTGPERETLAAAVRDDGLEEAVHFLGWRDDALSIMWAADLVVHPSLHEALPSAVIEAVMLGRPVVASDVSGVRDILGDDEYGRVVPPGDEDALRRALDAALASLEEARAQAERGRLYVGRYMDASRVAGQYLALYEAIAAQAGR